MTDVDLTATVPDPTFEDLYHSDPLYISRTGHVACVRHLPISVRDEIPDDQLGDGEYARIDRDHSVADFVDRYGCEACRVIVRHAENLRHDEWVRHGGPSYSTLDVLLTTCQLLATGVHVNGGDVTVDLATITELDRLCGFEISLEVNRAWEIAAGDVDDHYYTADDTVDFERHAAAILSTLARRLVAVAMQTASLGPRSSS